MADITKCQGTDCPIKNQCHRFTAEPDEYQSYFVGIPGGYEPTLDGKLQWKCDMFWGRQSTEIMNKLNDIVNGKERS